MSSIADGIAAWPRGVAILMSTPHTKRFLISFTVIIGILFGCLFAWMWNRILSFLNAVSSQSVESLGLDPGWWRDFVSWLLQVQIFIWLAKAGSFVVFMVFS